MEDTNSDSEDTKEKAKKKAEEEAILYDEKEKQIVRIQQNCLARLAEFYEHVIIFCCNDHDECGEMSVSAIGSRYAHKGMVQEFMEKDKEEYKFLARSILMSSDSVDGEEDEDEDEKDALT